MGVQLIGPRKTRQASERCGMDFDRVLRLDNHHWEGRTLVEGGHRHWLIDTDEWLTEPGRVCWSSCSDLPEEHLRVIYAPTPQLSGRDLAGLAANTEPRDGWPEGPYCECGHCHLEVISTGDAWKVAGEGDLTRLAVLPGHTEPYETAGHVLEHHDGWVAVGINGPPSDENVVSDRCPECNEYEPECVCAEATP